MLFLSCSNNMNDSIYIHISEKNKAYFSKNYYILPNGPLTNVKPTKKTFKEILDFNGSIQPIIVKSDNSFSFPQKYVVTKLPYLSTEKHYEICDYGIDNNRLFVYKKEKEPYSLLFLIVSEKDESIRIYPANLKPIEYSNIKQKYIKSINRTVKYIEIPSPDLLPKVPSNFFDDREGLPGASIRVPVKSEQ